MNRLLLLKRKQQAFFFVTLRQAQGDTHCHAELAEA